MARGASYANGDYVSQFVDLVTDSMVESIVDAISEANSRTAATLVAIGGVLASGVYDADVAAHHRRMGERAQQAVLSSYDQTVTRRKRPASRYPYRADAAGKNRRYAGGALRRALADSSFYEASPRGLAIINRRTLNTEARHWARLNAGAGGLGEGSRRRYEIRASNLVIGTLGLDMAPRPAFGVPPGYWLNRSEGGTFRGVGATFAEGTPASKRTLQNASDPGRVGLDEFYPTRRRPKRVTRGIEARNFLDAGVARIAEDLFDWDEGYPRLYRNLWERAMREGRQIGPRPGRFRAGAFRER